MRIIQELPIEILRHLYHSFLGRREVRAQMKQYLNSHKRNIAGDEYAVTLHNHSCDGKKQTIEEIVRGAASQGASVVGITDHNSDEPFRQQTGNKILKQYNFKGKIVYALKGMECNCISEDNEKIMDLMFIGYKDTIASGMNLNPVLELAHRNRALIGITSPLNEPFFGPNEEEMEKLLERGIVDYVEILNSSKGAPLFHNDALATIMLKEYNNFALAGKKVAGIYVSDSHVKKHVMGAFWN